MDLKFENLANIREYDSKYIKRKINYFLRYELDNRDYSNFLTRVEIVNNYDEGLKFYFLTGAGGYNYNERKIVLTDIKNRKELDVCIHHEVLHLKFAMNNQFEFNNEVEIIGYNFLNEFNSVYYSHMYNFTVNPNDEYSTKAVQNEIFNYRVAYDVLVSGLDDIAAGIKEKEISEGVQQILSEGVNNFLGVNNYLLARSIASFYIISKLCRKNDIKDGLVGNIMEYIREHVDLQNIKLKDCEEIGKLIIKG